MSKEILRKEIRFALHIPRTDYREDMHYVKQQVTYKDGTTEPQTFLTKDFKRPIWVTQQAFRNHKEKKEFEEVEHLMRQDVIQSDINKAVAGLLGSPWMASKPDEIKNSPFVYGYDITSTSLIKYTSLKRNDFVQSNYKVSAFDIETDIATREVIIATICFGNRIHSSVLTKFVKNVSNLDKRVHDAVDYYIPKYKDYDITVRTFDNEVDLLTDVFEVANQWGPDFLAIWNMDFDIPRILERLKEQNVNPVDVICDKSVPRKYRICRYKQGIKKKVTASGVVKPINPSLQWHTLFSTSKFYVIDAMCVYRQLRMAKQEEQSYALDAILKKEEIGGKLKFKEADAYSGEKWHIFMQENYPVEYIVYNFYDCLGMLELDDKIKDLKSSLPSFAAITDFAKFNSNPKKIVDALFLFGLERDRVIGTVPKQARPEEELEADGIETDDDEEEDDEYDVKKYNTLDLKGWIQLLPQNLLLAEGLKCLEEYPDVVTNMRGVVCDQDATAAYPSCTQVGNVSKETCVTEIIKIEGVREETFREMNLSICLGNANMIEYFTVMFGMPTFFEMEEQGLLD